MDKIIVLPKKKKKTSYEQLLKENKHFNNIFRIVIIGKTSSGKTEVLFNLLFRKNFCLDLFKKGKGRVVAFTPMDDVIEEMAELAKKAKFKPENFTIYDEWDSEICRKEYNNLDPKKPNLFILDDVSSYNFCSPIKKGIIDQIMCNGRHKSLFAIFTSQKYKHLNQNIRSTNTSHIIVMYGTSTADLEAIYKEHLDAILTDDQYKKLLKKYLSQKYSFFMVDSPKDQILDSEFKPINIEEL